MIKKGKYIVLFYAYEKINKKKSFKDKTKSCQKCYQLPTGLHNPFEKLEDKNYVAKFIKLFRFSDSELFHL